MGKHPLFTDLLRSGLGSGGLFLQMKRFTATEKWDKDWFTSLSPKLKCLWQLLCDRCDHAGVWAANYRLASFLIGERVTKDDVAAFGERVLFLESGDVLLTTFIEFQYGKLSKDCKAHIPVYKALDKHGLTQTPKGIQRVSIDYPNGIDSPLRGLQEEEEEKDTDKDTSSAKRLHGIPSSVEEVVEYGKSLRPVVDEKRCRAFWAYYEGQARTSPSGDTFWVTKGDQVVTKWKVKLPEFAVESVSQPKRPEPRQMEEVIEIRPFKP